LSDARLEVRLVYSGFLVLALLGFLSTAAFELKHVGPTPGRIAAYYRGGERGAELAFPKTFRELVETTHAHAFMMGVVFLVLAHLLIATTAPESAKRVAIVAAFLGLAGDLAGAWLIRYVSAGFAYVQPLCWVGQWVGVAAFVYYPVREMWFSHERDALPPD
jgi:hypothetical protein